MKKTTIFLITTVIFIACTPPANKSPNYETDSAGIVEPELQDTKDSANSSGAGPVDPELPENILSRISYSTDSEADLKQCAKLQGASKKANCYWLLAMKNKDQSFCDLIPPYRDIYKDITNNGKPRELNSDDAISQSQCYNQLVYTHGSSQWKLTSGMPGDKHSYEGKAKLHGWLIYKPFYVGEPEAHFHVSNIREIPVKYSDFRLYAKNGDIEKMIKLLEQYNGEHQGTILVDSISIPTEGSPSMNLVEIIENQ